MEPAPFESGRPGINTRWSQVSKGHGLSESDIMSRQRYFENSRSRGRKPVWADLVSCVTCRNRTGVEAAVSVVSNPSLPPTSCSSHKLHNFIQEQQKIVSSFRAQPWPMQMKLAAVRSVLYQNHVQQERGGMCVCVGAIE